MFLSVMIRTYHNRIVLRLQKGNRAVYLILIIFFLDGNMWCLPVLSIYPATHHLLNIVFLVLFLKTLLVAVPGENLLKVQG